MSSKLTLLVVIALAAAGGYWYFAGGEAPERAGGYQTDTVTTGRIESLVNTAGTISPVVTVDVGSELSGLISELHADFNSEVKSGQVIARIDDRTILARLRQIEADVASANASLQQQQANQARAAADLELAESEVRRQRELVARQLSSQAELDQAEAGLKIAAANLDVAGAQVAAARATVQQRQAQLEQTQLDLDRTYIKSPVDGTVIDRQVDVGQTVAASLSAPLLFQIAQDLTQMQIEADVDEADIGQIRQGLIARFTVDAFPDQTFTGTVTQVRKAATVTNNVVTYKVIVGAENPGQRLLPGMTANVNIVLGEKDDVLRVNNSALRFTPPGVENPAGGPGGPGGDLAERLDALVSELELDATQRRAVESAVADMRDSMAAMRNAGSGGFPGPGGFSNPREQFQRMRQRLNNQLSGVLTPDQLARFEAGFGGGRGARNPALADMRPGQVWVLDGEQPRPVRVLVGISDSQYSEVVSQDLTAGDEVIVRLAR